MPVAGGSSLPAKVGPERIETLRGVGYRLR